MNSILKILVAMALAISSATATASADSEPVIVAMGACGASSPCSAEGHPFVDALRDAGYTVVSPMFTNNNVNNAAVLSETIDSLRADSPTGKVKVVGTSMGGYSGLYTMRTMNQYVSTFVTVDSPVYGHYNNWLLCMDLAWNNGDRGGHLCKSGWYFKAIHDGDPTDGATEYHMVLNYNRSEGFAGRVIPDVLPGVTCTASFNEPHLEIFTDPAVHEAVVNMLEGNC